MPAMVVLERFPVPVLAVADDGAILFANSGVCQHGRSHSRRGDVSERLWIDEL